MSSLFRYGGIIAGIFLIAFVGSAAHTTALNTAYFAESVSMFVIVMGFALLLVGVGFLVLTLMALRRPATSKERRWAGSRAAYPSAG